MTWFASWKRAGCALLLAAGVGLACSATPEAEPTNRICAPGTNVVCKCKNRQTGTKLCDDDGTGYATECSVDGSELCPGGEEPGSSSGGRSSSSSSSSGSVPTNPDACPGALVAIPPNAPIEISNSTVGAADDAKGEAACAAGDGAPDHVYRIVPAGRGSLKVELTSKTTGYAPLAYLRRGDCEAGAQVACVAAGGGQGTEFTLNVVENEPYWLVVDGAAGPDGDGEYQITATLTPSSFCGDTVADKDEVCDDGNNVDGDGCSADCKNFNGNPPSAIQCPGQPVHLWVDTAVEVAGKGSTSSTALIGAKNTFNTVSQACIYAGTDGNIVGNDHVYDLIAHGTGQLYISFTNVDYDARASTWTSCDPADEQAWDQCGGVNPPTHKTDFDLPIVTLVDGQHYTLVVDGNVEAGKYDVAFLFTSN